MWVWAVYFSQVHRQDEERHVSQREFASELESRFQSSEQALKRATQENDRLTADLSEANEIARQLKGDLKDAQQQRRGLKAELNELSDR